MSVSVACVRNSKQLQLFIKKWKIAYPECSNLKYSSRPENHYDVIISGGGMVGTTLACTLGKNTKLSDKNILLLEGSKNYEFKLKEQYSNRVSTLNLNTFNLLNKIEAWKHIADGRYGLVKKLQVWDAISDAMITFEHDNLSENVAYVVENNLLVEAVKKELLKLQNVKVIYEAQFKSYESSPTREDLIQVYLEDGTTFTCNLLLGCDGINSHVRKCMGVQYISRDYHEKGIVATVQLSESTDNIVAWQRWLPTGPVALLPLNNNLSSLVWTVTTEQSKQLLSLSDEQFVDALNEAIWKSYPRHSVISEANKIVNNLLQLFQKPSNSVRQLPPSVAGIQPGSRAAFPLGFGHATNYVTKGVALVGDAAHRVHPLAGQGVNLGFGDVVALNDILGKSVYAGTPIGSLNCLKQYETQRQRHNVPTMLAVNGLHKLFGTDFTPTVFLRSVGLQMTHALTPLKKAIISHAAE